MKRTLSSFIVLLSESVWMYYTIALFSANVWAEGLARDLTWWLTVGITGYVIHAVLAGRVHYAVLLTGSAIGMALAGIQYWNIVMPIAGAGYGSAVTVALCILFIRGAFLAYRQPARLNMLRHFEGNIAFYVIYVLIFSVNQWLSESFHLLFLGAIFASLMGMVMALQSYEEAGEGQQAEVRAVGQSGWFAGVFALLSVGIVLLCAFLLLPSIRGGLYAFSLQIWAGIVWLGSAIGRFIVWLFSLLPQTPPGEVPPMMPPIGGELPEQPQEPPGSDVLAPWILGGLAVLAAVIAVIGIVFFLKRWQPPKAMKARRYTVYKTSWWVAFRKAIANQYRRLRTKWRMRFPHHYTLRIYWLFQQVERLGEKRGLPRGRADTSKEYVEKMIRHLPEHEDEFYYEAKSYRVSDLLRSLNEAYQAAYYGGSRVDTSLHEYDILLRHLRSLKGKKTSFEANSRK